MFRNVFFCPECATVVGRASSCKSICLHQNPAPEMGSSSVRPVCSASPGCFVCKTPMQRIGAWNFGTCSEGTALLGWQAPFFRAPDSSRIGNVKQSCCSRNESVWQCSGEERASLRSGGQGASEGAPWQARSAAPAALCQPDRRSAARPGAPTLRQWRT